MTTSTVTTDAAPNSVAPSMAAGGIDLQQLVRRCLGNLEFADRVLTTFLNGLDIRVQELEQAVEQRDLERVWKLAHRLKGEAGNLGAMVIVDLAARTDAAAREGVEPAVVQRVRELTDACRNLRRDAFTFSSLATTAHEAALLAAFKRPV